jgi:hypothetical protein
VCTRILFPTTSSAPTGDSPVGEAGPQPVPSTAAGGPAIAPATPLSPPAPVASRPGGPEPEATPREVETALQGSGDVPQGETAPSAVAGGEPVATAAPGAMAEPSLTGPAAEEAAATVEAAAVEVAEAPNSDPAIPLTPVLLPEPRPRHSADSSPGWPRSSNSGRCTGRSARGGGYRGIPLEHRPDPGPASGRDPSGPPEK